MSNNNTGETMIKGKKYIKTDLAIELIDEREAKNSIKIGKGITIDRIYLDTTKYGKSIGNYITISFTDFNKDTIVDILSDELDKMLANYKRILVVGLGNHRVTSDSLGPLVIENIVISKNVYAVKISPDTGIETFSYIKALTNSLCPNIIIVIDSLVSKSIDRLSKTIQMSDTGITPGSGVGKYKKEISIKTLNVPVISIGAPTTVEVKTIISDILDKEVDISNNFLVTPKDIDYDIKYLSYIIADSINKSLYKDTL